jgi:hypothetical protein
VLFNLLDTFCGGCVCCVFVDVVFDSCVFLPGGVVVGRVNCDVFLDEFNAEFCCGMGVSDVTAAAGVAAGIVA